MTWLSPPIVGPLIVPVVNFVTSDGARLAPASSAASASLFSDASPSVPHLRVEALSFAWPQGVRLHDVSLTLYKGAFCLLDGPSGAGKSTLLRLLVRLEKPHSGRILLHELDIASLDPTRLRRRVALVGQMPIMGTDAAGDEPTVEDVLCLPFTFRANSDMTRPTSEALRALLEVLHLQDVPLSASAERLSVGQRQRLALARQLALSPEILLLDEPTSALDAESRQGVEACIERVNASGVTVLMITHTAYRPARSHRLCTLRAGTLHYVAEGTP